MLEKEIKDLEAKMNQPEFWNDPSEAKRVSKEVSAKKFKSDQIQKLMEIKEELETYILLIKEENSNELIDETVRYLEENRGFVKEAEIQVLMGEEADQCSAVLSIHPGAGGTESQDWADMLLRMYCRWAEMKGRKLEIVEYQAGDEAGIKSVTVEIMGDYAFGLLKSETGIHRLVRISPFNAQGKRQTSFASVFVYPLIDDDIEVEINPEDLRIDTYRASGKGGQGVNTTDSAVRITHLPTNIVVSCQNERSQLSNKETAMNILRSRLYQQMLEEKQKEKQKLENTKTDIGWGNQIRSYVFHPYQMVKDHRTNQETGNTSAVMDGSIDDFIYSYLKFQAERG